MKLLYPRHEGARVSDDLSVKDLRLLVLENNVIRVSLLLDKGADVVEFLHKPTDTDFMWRTPNGIRSPKSEPNFHGHEQYFNAYYEGGWQELFPHGSAPMKVSGATLPMHGEVQALPWKHAIVKDEPDEVVVKLWVRTLLSPFLLERTLSINASDPWVRFDEKATLLGKQTFEILWGHHPAFGAPFLSPDCTIEFPKGKFVDGDASCQKIPPVGGKGNMCYLHEFDEGWYGIHNAKRKIGFGMKWDAKFFPVIWIWQGFGGGGYPHFGREYACAIEPFTSFPAAHYDIKGRVPVEPGQVLETMFWAFAYDGKVKETVKKI